MHAPRAVFSLLGAILAIAAATAAWTVNPAIAAPDPGSTISTASVYWGAYVAGAPFDASLLDAFEARTGKKMSIVHWGQPWIMNGRNLGFQTAQYESVRKRGAIPMVSWASFELDKGVNQPAFRLASIANGKYDAYITRWAQAARAWGHPFFLRFDWEMNGFWQFPWAEQLNGNHSGDYVRAWRHVHDIFAQQGATNATWVWCPNVSGAKTTPLANLYPGDSYVDWTCMDGYNWGTDDGNTWQAFNLIFFGSAYNGHHNTYAELLALAPDKPIMIGETASSEHGGSKAAWISDMLVQVPKSFPRVRAVVWMDWNAGDSKISWPLTSSSDATNAFANGIAAPSYVTNGFASLAPLAAVAAPPDAPALAPVLPDVAAPELAPPTLAAPDVVPPEIAPPDLAPPEIAAPDFVAPEVVTPEVVAPEVVAPEVVVPDVVAADVAAPDPPADQQASATDATDVPQPQSDQPAGPQN